MTATALWCPICGSRCAYLPKTVFHMKYAGKPSFQCQNCCNHFPVTVEEQDQLFPKLQKAAELMGTKLPQDRIIREVEVRCA